MSIHNSFSESSIKPFGAVKVGEEVEIRVWLENSYHIDWINLDIYRFIDISPQREEELFHYLKIPMYLERTEENEYVYLAKVSFEESNYYYYHFTLRINGQDKFIEQRDCQSRISNTNEGKWQITVYQDSEFPYPYYLEGGVIYHIFVDRFFNSHTPKKNVPEDIVMHENWGELPVYLPNSNGIVENNDYFGGDLKGITQKLPYLDSLGVTALYLSPIVEAHSNHRYDAADFTKVDPILGTFDDFIELCNEAHKRNMRIILDGVYNHTGSDSVYFNKKGRYPTVGAYQSKDSLYHDWYYFYNHPDSYECWWGMDIQPKLNKENKKVQELICGKNGAIDTFIHYADCFRLDVIDELSIPFTKQVTRAVKTLASDGEPKGVYGEVWEDATTKKYMGHHRKYLLGKGSEEVDSVMNYDFKNAIIAYVRYGNVQYFTNTIMLILSHYPKPAIKLLMNFLSTHDTIRAINALGAEELNGKGMQWQAEHLHMPPEERANAIKLFKVATFVQMFLPGIPCIYYGDEAGVEGWDKALNRLCYPWGNEDTELIHYISTLTHIRKEYKETIKETGFRFLNVTDKYCVFERYHNEHSMIFAFSRSRRDNQINYCIPDDSLKKYHLIYSLENATIENLSSFGAIILTK